MSKPVRIGELARRAGMTADGIRFYEKRGLLPKAPRSRGRFRLYTTLDLDRVRFIRRMQMLGFSLNEIREFVDLREHEPKACETVRRLLQAKLGMTRSKIEHLRELEADLLTGLQKCDEELKRRQRQAPGACPVLEEVDK